MTQRQRTNGASTLTLDSRRQIMCAAALLAALAIAFVPASAIGASNPASQAESLKDSGAAAVDVGDAEVPARSAGVAGEVDRETSKRFIAHIDKDDLFANELERADVITGDGKDIGKVQDVLISADGQVRALIVEVGGMLGLGEKQVAVRYDRFERDVNDEGMLRLKLQVTEHELREAPRFIPVREYDTEPQTGDK